MAEWFKVLVAVLVAAVLAIDVGTRATEHFNQLNPPTPRSGEGQQHHERTAPKEHQEGQGADNATQHGPSPPVRQDAPPHHDGIGTQPDGEGQWYTRPDWWVAGFTGLLALLTGALWLATWGMWRTTARAVADGEKAIKTAVDHVAESARAANEMAKVADAAQKSAEAADLSAKALLSLEGPSVFVTRVETYERRDEETFYSWIKRAAFTVTLENFGRSPAFVDEVTVKIHIGPTLPKPSPLPFQRFTAHNEHFVVPPTKKHDFIAYSCFAESYPRPTNAQFEEWFGLNRDEITVDADIEGEDPIEPWVYIYGIVRHQDFIGDRHEIGFLHLCVEGSNQTVAIRTEAGYTFRHRLPRQDKA